MSMPSYRCWGDDMKLSKLFAGIRNVGLIGILSSVGYFIYSLMYLNYISIFATSQNQFLTAANSLFSSLSSVYMLMIAMTIQSVGGEVLKIIADVKDL